MNRTFRSIWNPSLGTFVAAAETQPARGRSVSGTRAARRQACRAGVAPLALEPRIVFDAAMAATVVDVQSDSGADAGNAEAVAAWVADEDSEPADENAAVEPAATEAAEAEAPAATEPSGGAAVQALEDGAGDDTGESDTVTQALDDSDPQATAPEPAPAREIIFVDPVASSLDEHLQNSGAEIIYLSADRDGVEQMAQALQGQTGITAIHIVSHGVEGRLMLGNTVLDAASMQAQHLQALQTIGAALGEEGDILIYGCNFTVGETGLNAAHLLAEITGADVAASDDTTGHADRGGDWALETSIGHVQTLALAPSAWMGTLDLVIQNVGSIGTNALATAIMGPGVTINSATYSGGGDQAGVFSTGAGISFGGNILEFTEGAIFTTHSTTSSVAGPNNNGGLSSNAPSGIDNNPDFNAASGGFNTFDASFIVINFTPDVFPGGSVGDTGRMTASLVFGSEEYNEYVYSGFNDTIGIWVNGTNVALAPNGLAIGIDTINDAANFNPAQGNPANDPNPGHSTTSFTSANPNLYVNNSTATYNTQMDGFTVTISLTFDVIIGQQNTIKLGIADTGDASLDSWLFIKAESLQTAFVPENDSVTTPANVPASVDLTANDFNLNGGALDIIAINGTTLAPGGSVVLDSGVTVTLNGGGNVTVTGDGVNAVSDTFTYTVENQDGQTGNAIVSVNITAPTANSPPVAVDDSFAAGEDDAAAVRGNALSNDSDPDGNPLSAVAQTNVAGSNGGLFSINAAGQVTFNPNGAFESLAAGQTATTSFTYTVSDGQGGTDTATVTVTVTGANDAPVAVDDGFAAGEDAAAAVVGNALTNDSDVDGGTLAATPQTGVAGSGGGLFSINAAGQVTFNPNGEFEALAPGQTTTTSFTYTVSDGQGGTDTATVTVTVTGANDAPVAVDDGFAAGEDDAAAVVGNALTNDSDVDGGTLAATPQTNVAGSNGGLFSINAAGQVTFNPNGAFESLAAGQTATTSFTYTVSDGQGGTDTATVTVTVTGANDAPVAVDDGFAAGEDDAAAVVGNAITNDSDVDGGTLAATPQTHVAGSHGGLFSINAAGQVTFDPNGEFQGLAVGQTATTSFTYTVSDGQGGSDTATVTVTVTGTNDAPTLVPGGQPGAQAGDDGELITPLDVSSAFTDIDGDTLGYSASGLPPGLTIDPVTGVISGTLASNASQGGPANDGVYSVTVTATDPSGLSVDTVFSWTIGNPAPVAVNDDFAAGEDDAAAVVGNALGNDSDPDGDTLSATPQSNVAGSNGGLFSINAAGQVTFDPNGEFDGLAAGQTATTSFTYTVSDGQGGSDTATVTVTVTGANDDPVAVDDSVSTDEDTPLTIDVLANDSDTDGDTLTVTTATAGNGTVVINPDGTITYTPDADFHGSDTISYTISDGNGGTATATVTVTVNPVNDAPTLVPGSQPGAQAGDDGELITPLDVSSAFTDVDGDTLGYSASGLPPGLAIDPVTGVISGTLASNASQGGPANDGVYSVTVTATDPSGLSVDTVFSWTIGNPAPVALNDDLAAGEDDAAAVVGNALGNDSDPDGDSLSATVQSNVAGSHGGLFSIDAAGQVTFDPNGEFDGLAAGQTATTSFTYTVSDGQGGSDTATVTVTMTGGNDVPVAVDDSVSTDEDTPLTIDVLANDSDTDGDTLTVTTATAGNGTVVINPDGTITYTPDADFHGSDTISYTISDGNGGTATATVTVTVNPVNDAPVAVNDGPLAVTPGRSVTGNVLTNDSDIDGDALSVTGFAVDTNRDGVPESFVAGQTAVIRGVGTLVVQADGNFVFTPASGYAGNVPVATYTVSDGQAQATANLQFDAVPEVVLPLAPPPPPPPAPAPAPLPTVTPPTDVGPSVVSAPVPPAADSSGSVAPELHVLYAVSSAHTEGAIMASGLSLGTSDPLLAEAMAQAPDGLLFEGMADMSAASLLAPEGMSSGSPALHVQHAVRHEPVAPEHGSYIQRVVRSAQVESRLGDAVVRAQTELQMAEEALLFMRAVGEAPGDAAQAPATATEGATPPANTPGAAPGGFDRQPGGPAPGEAAAVEDDRLMEGEAPTPDEEATQQPVNTGPIALGFRDQLARMAQQPGGWGRPVTRVAVAA